MPEQFKTIGLIGRTQQQTRGTLNSLAALRNLLLKRNVNVVLDEETATAFKNHGLAVVKREQLGAQCDLLIVVGGDGSLLTAARSVVDHDTPLLGINRGQLGFLTDIHPSEVDAKVAAVLDGHFVEEQRFLFTVTKHEAVGDKVWDLGAALNDVVVMPGEVPQMIEFETYIDDKFMCAQRADGVIVSTPTGSTAYALSGGGPILHPNLDALVLVPMFSHTLSSRPIVVSGDSKVRLVISKQSKSAARVSCDGQERIPLAIGASVHIQKKAKKLRLIHPEGYHYFETLRSKLGWENR